MYPYLKYFFIELQGTVKYFVGESLALKKQIVVLSSVLVKVIIYLTV
jgi:hypothetical protein